MDDRSRGGADPDDPRVTDSEDGPLQAGSSRANPFRFGSFVFDERTGEIERRDGAAPATRLTPQPARLLAHLIRRSPELVSSEEIRELLWPDTQVDYEQSLHTCIRQIRAALGDSASAPRYVETIPRRGYRFLADVSVGAEVEREEDRAEDRETPPTGRVATPRDAPAPPPHAASHSRQAGRRLRAGLGAAFGLVLIVLVLRAVAGDASTPVRIAVMPFEPLPGQTELGLLESNNDLAESIVALLVATREPTLEVIGPSTTESYDGRPARLRELIEEHRVAYVVNARQTGGDAPPRVLIEIIRDDGAHVWARYLDDLPAGEAVPAVVARAAVAAARD